MNVMKKLTSNHCFVVALALAGAPFTTAQNNGLPTSQPNRLVMIREDVKVGHNADHAKNEAGWPAAFEKAKSPNYYLAATSMTGPNVAWYLVPFASYAAEGETMKREDKDPVLSAELARLALRDAEFINNVNVVHTVARTDLSLGKFPDVAKIRFSEISFCSVKQGQEQKVEDALKTYAAVRKRVAPDSSYRVYEVVAGMPGPTFVIIQSVEDYAQFDQTSANHNKVFVMATADEKKEFDKWGEAVARWETNRFRIDPVQSYVSKEVRTSDPEFWSPK